MSDLFKNSYIAPEKDLVSLSVCNVGYQNVSRSIPGDLESEITI